MFGNSISANNILKADTPLQCKKLSYKIHGVDRERWRNDGYEVCYDGIREKFVQNTLLLQLLKTMAPKTLVEATMDRLWGTGITLRDTCTTYRQMALRRLAIQNAN